MIFHENHLLADDSHEISYLIFSKIGKDVAKFVLCCSCDWGLRVNLKACINYQAEWKANLASKKPADLHWHHFHCWLLMKLADPNPHC